MRPEKASLRAINGRLEVMSESQLEGIYVGGLASNGKCLRTKELSAKNQKKKQQKNHYKTAKTKKITNYKTSLTTHKTTSHRGKGLLSKMGGNG